MSDIAVMQLISNILLYLFWLLFCSSMLERRFPFWVTLLAWAGCFLVCFFQKMHSDTATAARLLVGIAIILSSTLALFKSRWTRALFSVGVTQVVMIVCEFVLLLLFPDVMWAMGSGESLGGDAFFRVLGVCILCLMLNGLILWVAAKLLGRYKGRLPGNEWLIYAIFLVCQIVMLGSWFQIYVYGSGQQAYIWLGCDVALCLAADMGLYFVMRGMAQRAALRAENALLEKQIDAQKEHYAALTAQYENVRRMRHDIASHVHTIQILLENGETAQAEAYAAELLPKTAYKPNLGRCENPVADAFLYTRMEELRAQGLDITVEAALPAYLSISNSDLIIAFGNLLDNAAEACRELEDKRVTLSAGLAKGCLVIETENPLPAETPQDKKRRIPELERGVGFSILTELAQKYDGSFTHRAADGIYSARLALREEAANAANSGM